MLSKEKITSKRSKKLVKALKDDSAFPLNERKLVSDAIEMSYGLGERKSPELEERKSTSDAPKYLWTSYGSGGYNRVWKSNFNSPQRLVEEESYQGPWILKYPITSKNTVLNEMNNPIRAVRLFNELNPKLPKAGLYKLGWVGPFIANARQSTDKEIAHKLIEIYSEYRRIVVDAATEGNFLTGNDDQEVNIVDVDLALKRSNSFASFEYAKNLENRFASYWSDPVLNKTMPITLEVTRNLLFLEDHLLGSMDELCEKKLITLQNVRSLTWLRQNHKTLSLELFMKIATLNEIGLANDRLLAALVSAEDAKSQLKRNSPELLKISGSALFFKPIPDQNKVASINLKEDVSNLDEVKGVPYCL